MKKLLLSSILGGFAAFVWMALSWTALKFHPTSSFKNEAEVAEVLKRNAGGHDVYLLPGDPGNDAAAHEKAMKAADAGPFAYMVVRPGPKATSMGKNIALNLLTQILCAFLLTSLLLCARPLSYGARVLFIVQAALAGGMLCHLSPMIWWEVPLHWVLRELADLAVAWTLGGLVIAKITAPSPGA
jgi:hypothetical protein